MLLWARTHRRFGFSSLAALAATCLLGRGTGTTGTATRGAGPAARAVAPAAARIIRAEAIFLLPCCCLPVHVAHKQQVTGFGSFLISGPEKPLQLMQLAHLRPNPDRADGEQCYRTVTVTHAGLQKLCTFTGTTLHAVASLRKLQHQTSQFAAPANQTITCATRSRAIAVSQSRQEAGYHVTPAPPQAHQCTPQACRCQQTLCSQQPR